MFDCKLRGDPDKLLSYEIDMNDCFLTYRVSAKKVLGFELVASSINPKLRESLFMCTVLPMLQVDVYNIAIRLSKQTMVES